MGFRTHLPAGGFLDDVHDQSSISAAGLFACGARLSDPGLDFEDGAFAVALARIGLSRLAPDLDASRRWERELSADEQQGLQFARLLLHRPRWILIHEALDALDEETRALVLDVFALELAGSAILNIGRPDTQKGFFSRILHLIDDPKGEKLNPCLVPGPAEPRASPSEARTSANANLIN